MTDMNTNMNQATDKIANAVNDIDVKEAKLVVEKDGKEIRVEVNPTDA